MQSHSNSVQDAQGNARPGATVFIYNAGTQDTASIFSNNGLTGTDNPITTDKDGSFYFWAADGRYDVTSVYGSLTDTYEITLFDPEDDVEIGDPGTEAGGMNINGTVYDARLRVNDVGGTKPAMMTLHRHSTTLPAIILGSRANDNTTGHTAVVANQSLFSLYGAGWTGTHYDLFGSLNFRAAAGGTINSTSSPGAVDFSTTPDSSNTPTVAMTIDETQNIGIGISTPDTALHVWESSAGSVTANASTVVSIEKSGTAYLELLTPDISTGGFLFSGPTKSGRIEFTSAKATLQLGSGASGSYLILDDDNNLQLGLSAPGSGGTNTIVIEKGTAPGSPPDADSINVYADTAGAGATTLGLYLGETESAIGTFTPSHKIRIAINGTLYWIQLDAV